MRSAGALRKARLGKELFTPALNCFIVSGVAGGIRSARRVHLLGRFSLPFPNCEGRRKDPVAKGDSERRSIPRRAPSEMDLLGAAQPAGFPRDPRRSLPKERLEGAGLRLETGGGVCVGVGVCRAHLHGPDVEKSTTVSVWRPFPKSFPKWSGSCSF